MAVNHLKKKASMLFKKNYIADQGGMLAIIIL